MEVARLETDRGAVAGVIQRSQIANVAAQADVVREVAHQTSARVPAEIVVRRTDRGDRPAIDLRTDKAESCGCVRTETGATRAADRNADDHIAHQIQHAVVAEVARVAEEARTPAEVELAADDAFAHRADLRAESDSTVVEAAADIAAVEAGSRVRRHPRTDVAFRARLHRRERQGSDRRRRQNLRCSSHCCTSVEGRCKRYAPNELVEFLLDAVAELHADELSPESCGRKVVRLRATRRIRGPRARAGECRTSRPRRGIRSAAAL